MENIGRICFKTSLSVFTPLHLLAILLIVSACESEIVPESKNLDSLKEGFSSPPPEARPKAYWWWLNGYADTLRLKQELNAMQAMGISGLDIFEIGTTAYSNPGGMVLPGPAFMSKASLDDIAFAIDEAQKLEMEIGLNLASSWNAGGSWIGPEHAAKSLFFSKTTIQGPHNGEIALPMPDFPNSSSKQLTSVQQNLYKADGTPKFIQEVAVLAIPSGEKTQLDTANIHLLNQHLADGKLNWEFPAGKWDVYRYVCSNSAERLKLPSPNSDGLIIDHFDEKATVFHFGHFVDKLTQRLGDLKQSALTYFYLASYEATGFVWTPKLPQAFEDSYGYSMLKFLPILHEDQYGASSLASGFLHDYRNTLSDLIINNHYKKGSEIANQHGLRLISESGGPGPPLHNVPVEALGALGALDVPRGEFWYKHHRYDEDSIDLLRVVKGPGAAGNIYRRQPVEMEAFTSFHHWEEGPGDIKSVGDRAFCEGMSKVVFHGSSHNPSRFGNPGIAYHAGTHIHDKRVWWPMAKPFMEYLGRVSYMMQQGRFQADVLYYHGDRAPNIVRPKNVDFTAGIGYDYEVVNTEILLDEVTCVDGKIHIPGVGTYRLLALHPEERMNPKVWEKLLELRELGGIIVGEKPVGKAGLGISTLSEKEMLEQMEENWLKIGTEEIHSAIEQKKILAGVYPQQVLQALAIKPDFTSQSLSKNSADKPLIDFIHKAKEDVHYYFLRNSSDYPTTQLCDFRQSGLSPQLWDPVSGEFCPLPVFNIQGEVTTIPLSFAPFQSFFIVFSNGNPQGPTFKTMETHADDIPFFQYNPQGLLIESEQEVSFHNEGQTVAFTKSTNPFQLEEGDWELTFPEGLGAPKKVSLPRLTSWTENDDPGIKYFSGIATYDKSFTYPDLHSLEKGKRILLDLGEVEKVAEVWLNGQNLGITWTYPHTFEVSEILVEGENKLTVKVANVWANRIIGDHKEGNSYTETNIVRVRGEAWETIPLVASGLLGPVSLSPLHELRPN
ncbi:glycosyl hydrolase [Pleomorphovibrio marinus]|uniref:glycosyl hydrolase n=1 Tax=Pleomorphovibrio marinus TaxID=2164132 RepID=UPI000E0A0986|nr:glycosyl hydrolase [Pleomorphovibrio marinus]